MPCLLLCCCFSPAAAAPALMQLLQLIVLMLQPKHRGRIAQPLVWIRLRVCKTEWVGGRCVPLGHCTEALPNTIK